MRGWHGFAAVAFATLLCAQPSQASDRPSPPSIGQVTLQPGEGGEPDLLVVRFVWWDSRTQTLVGTLRVSAGVEVAGNATQPLAFAEGQASAVWQVRVPRPSEWGFQVDLQDQEGVCCGMMGTAADGTATPAATPPVAAGPPRVEPDPWTAGKDPGDVRQAVLHYDADLPEGVHLMVDIPWDGATGVDGARWHGSSGGQREPGDPIVAVLPARVGATADVHLQAAKLHPMPSGRHFTAPVDVRCDRIQATEGGYVVLGPCGGPAPPTAAAPAPPPALALLLMAAAAAGKAMSRRRLDAA